MKTEMMRNWNHLKNCRSLPVARGFRLLPWSCMAVYSPCTTVPAIDSLFSLPLIWLMNQHYLNCFIAACVYFTHTLTFLFLLLLIHTYTSKQQWLAVSLNTTDTELSGKLFRFGSLTSWLRSHSAFTALNNLTVHLLSKKSKSLKNSML